MGGGARLYNFCLTSTCPWRRKWWMVLMLPCKCSWPPALEMTLQELSDSSSGTTLHVSALCLPHVTACDQIFQAFPLHFCTLQEIKRLEWGTAWEQGYINWVNKLSGPNFVWKCYNLRWGFWSIHCIMAPKLEPIQVCCGGFEWYA